MKRKALHGCWLLFGVWQPKPFQLLQVVVPPVIEGEDPSHQRSLGRRARM
jgi:hypothetical protein